MQQTLPRREPARCSWVMDPRRRAGAHAGTASVATNHAPGDATPATTGTSRAPRLPGGGGRTNLCGSSCFTVGAFAASFPGAVEGALLDGTLLGWRFAVGAVFFTGAASLQWLEALKSGKPPRWALN